MKKITSLLLFASIMAATQGCKQPLADEDTTFTFSVEEDKTDFTGLPALHSFAIGESASGHWLMFGGRTNGFHGFGNEQDFPYKMANHYIYVYNTATHELDSMSIHALPAPLDEQFASTNMQNRQVDEYLYVCGGYGQVNAGQPDSSWITHNIMTRVDIEKMVNAVLNNDTVALAASAVYDTSAVVRATGGELFKLPDGKFYLVLGHDFRGAYSDNSHYQQYLDSVHVFSLTETANSIKINGPFQYISDNLPDSTTQFRRRDLVVSPNVLKGGKDYGISIYAGVFTIQGNPFSNPIYLTGGDTPSYTIDTVFNQVSNVYSAPNLQMYDDKNDRVYTTIFGGLGDTVLVNGDNASWVKLIATLNKDNQRNTTSPVFNPTGMPDYVGSEGIFIKSKDAPVYKKNKLGILDYNKIKTGDKQLLGYIYGGIHSDSTQWNNVDTTEVINGQSVHYKLNLTTASAKVYKVWITKEK